VTSEWESFAWSEVEPGDFIRDTKETIYRVASKDGNAVVLERPDKNLSLKANPEQTVSVRTFRNSLPTDAHRRVYAALHAAEAKFKAELDAELVSVQDLNPSSHIASVQVLTTKYTPSTLSAHLYVFHGLYIGEPPKEKELKDELRATHAEFHKTLMKYDAGLRLPHVHNQTEYERLLK
jgi:hypothetical protein